MRGTRPRPASACLACALIVIAAACAGSGEPARPRSAAQQRAEPTASAKDSRPAAPAAAALPAATPPASETRLGVRDAGIFSDLDPRVQLRLPPGLDPTQVEAVVDRARGQLVLYAASWPIKVYPLQGETGLQIGDTRLALRPGDRAELAPLLAPDRLHVFEQRVALPPGDADDDGIPDPLDLLIGAHKTALNADRYDGRYERIGYPGGDVPREIGVCTDVVIRALRNAGVDLQRAVHEDIRKQAHAYPMIHKPDPNIDHRRVKSLVRYFERNYRPHTPQLQDAADPLRAGDIVFMDTFPDRPGTEHVGIVSDLIDEGGRRLVINNWTDGSVTRPMELLSWVKVTHRFRLGELATGGPIPVLATQLLLVLSDSWTSWQARLQRYERAPGRPWQRAGDPIAVVLGHGGYGWGEGLHGSGAPRGRSGPLKREGDGRSPAGVFELGTAYGYAQGKHPALRIAYVPATPQLRCVDDPASRHYNRIVSSAEVEPDWKSAERMRRDDDVYELAIEIGHNREPVIATHGSCIFLHVWVAADTPVTGCTAMARSELETLSRWLGPNSAVLVALPRAEARALRRDWNLPD